MERLRAYLFELVDEYITAFPSTRLKFLQSASTDSQPLLVRGCNIRGTVGFLLPNFTFSVYLFLTLFFFRPSLHCWFLINYSFNDTCSAAHHIFLYSNKSILFFQFTMRDGEM